MHLAQQCVGRNRGGMRQILQPRRLRELLEQHVKGDEYTLLRRARRRSALHDHALARFDISRDEIRKRPANIDSDPKRPLSRTHCAIGYGADIKLPNRKPSER